MDSTIQWLKDRPYYTGQLEDERIVDGSEGSRNEISIDKTLKNTLSTFGIEELYEHQVKAIMAVRNEQNVVLATPTASGKSLAYTIPAFESALDSNACTLYIAPQVALINDQHDTLSEYSRKLGFGNSVRVEQYTGRLNKSEKRDVRERQPTFLLTTPDMLHYGILPHSHRLWDRFFKNLEYIVLDEIHEYRGVFGTHVSLLLRRLNRVADRFESNPNYICCSATMGNPSEHASNLTNRSRESIEVIEEDTSETGPTHWLFWNPPTITSDGSNRRSNHVESKSIFVDLVSRGLQTVVFTPARQAAERYATESAEELRERGDHELADAITAYQAALRNERRSEIEDGLHSGDIRGVWSTNALELGVDIGGLDAVILDGYPGTRLAAFQQAGRAGRGTEPSLVVLVAGEDQLDQYFMNHAEEFFDGELENAVVNPENEEILPDHVKSAARENWLSPEDDIHFGSRYSSIVTALEDKNLLERRSTGSGVRWTYSGDDSPQHSMSLRTIDDREIQLIDTRTDTTIGRLPFADALRDAHPGAIYHHQGETFEVTDLDLSRDIAELSPKRADYYTQVLHEKEISVQEDLESKTLSTREDVPITFASITMQKQITGYERRDLKSGEAYGRVSLDLPQTSLRTKALYFTIPDSVETEMRSRDGDFNGGIHAAEHGMIAMFPLELLCDRRDIGGLSTPFHPHTNKSTIFIYDGYPGGVGLTRQGYESVEELMVNTHRMIENCSCTDGCPSCVQSPHCGNANDPLDKSLAKYLLSTLTES